MFGLPLGTLIAIVFAALFIFNWIKVLSEYERGVVFRFGKLLRKPKGPGLVFVFAPIDRMVRVSTRLVTFDVPPQDVITKDNVSVKVNAVILFRVVDPVRSVIEVENFVHATSQIAQTTLRAVLGDAELDELLSHRDELNRKVQEILDDATDPWGIKVTTVEVKDVDLPGEMARAMAKQAEAERERRAKIIHAQGEDEAASQLASAAKKVGAHPLGAQLRYLQTLTEIASEKNSTIIFPLPMDIVKPFLEMAEARKERAVAPTASD